MWEEKSQPRDPNDMEKFISGQKGTVNDAIEAVRDVAWA